MIQSILLATDGSSASERAANFAASLAKCYHARVTVVHAFTPVPVVPGEPNSKRSLYETQDQARSLVDRVEKRLHEMGINKVGTEVIEGPPAHVILGVAETCQPDMIVVGARGLSTWQGALLGSVSMAVAQRSEFPVLVVR
jgi:nucleotide-binding universal stress UspA family protein